MIIFRTVVYASHPPYSTEVNKYDGPVIVAETWEDAKRVCREMYPYAQVTGETDDYLTGLIFKNDEHQQDS